MAVQVGTTQRQIDIKSTCSQPLKFLSFPFLLRILALTVTLSGKVFIIFSHLPTFTGTREIFLPLDEDWMHYFCCFLNHLDTIKKPPLARPDLKMCKVRLARVSRAVQWCAGHHGGSWGLIPLHSILMATPEGCCGGCPCQHPAAAACMGAGQHHTAPLSPLL